MAGFIGANVLDGTLTLWGARDLENVTGSDYLLLDVRSAAEFATGHLPGAVNVAHTDLRDRLGEVQKIANGRPVWVYCASGFRSYLAHRILEGAGIASASLDGGLQTLLAGAPQAVVADMPSHLRLVS